MKQKYNCKIRECTDDELAYSQLSNQTVTRKTLVDFPTLPPIESYKELNPDLIEPPEMPYFKKKYNVTNEEKLIEIANNTMKLVFDIDQFSAKKSILNPVNGEKFFQQMETNTPIQDLHYAYIMGLKQMSFYSFLYKYLNFLVSTYADFTPLGGSTKDTAFAELALLASGTAIKHISKYLQHILYARVLDGKFRSEKIKCGNTFLASKIDLKKVAKICGDYGFNFTLLSSFEIWTSAGLRGKNATEYIALQGRFELSDVRNLINFH